jgi:hypothetical protein
LSSKELKEIRINLKERESNDWPKAKSKKKMKGRIIIIIIQDR